jgi:hypothetical protein
MTTVTCSKLRVLFLTANEAWMVRNRLPRRKEGCLVLLGQHSIASNGLANLNPLVRSWGGRGGGGGRPGGGQNEHSWDNL